MDSSHFIRIGLIVLCLLVAPVFPLSLAAAAFLGWTIWEDFHGPKSVPPEGWVDIDTLTAESEGWLNHFQARCESPAEEAFLMAMLKAFQMEPKAGTLVGQGLRLHMQVPVGRYRLDFLVDKRLVVEVDGAAYHSSPEAIEHDRKRDAFLRAKGYEVLRIPAKVTLRSPDIALERVRQARLAVAAQDQEKSRQFRESLHPSSLLASIKDAGSATLRTWDEVSTKAEENRKRQEAEEKAREARGDDGGPEASEEIPRSRTREEISADILSTIDKNDLFGEKPSHTGRRNVSSVERLSLPMAVGVVQPVAEDPSDPPPKRKAERLINGFREDEIPY